MRAARKTIVIRLNEGVLEETHDDLRIRWDRNGVVSGYSVFGDLLWSHPARPGNLLEIRYGSTRTPAQGQVRVRGGEPFQA